MSEATAAILDPAHKHPTDGMTIEEHAAYMTKVIAARKLLAEHDPIGESMEVLAAAGCVRCKVSGRTPAGMTFKVEGGAPEPRRGRR